MLRTMPISTSLPQDEHTFRIAERGWHNSLVDFVQTGVPKLISALLIAAVATWIVLFFVRRMHRRANSLVANPYRAAQLRTVAGIIRATAFGLIGAYLLIQALGAVGVPLGPFIASAGVIGLGISFGAQSIFKDMLNGIFILLEDQYNVGDVIKVSGLTGTVEYLTLRLTKLRDGDGTLYMVPNSQITTVSNLSRDFSVATLNVSVDTRENPDHVLEVLQRLAVSVRADEAFAKTILADPVVLGVDKITGHEVVYPINLRVLANQRDGVLRELRRRILLEFQKEHINFGASSSTVLIQPQPDAAANVATN
jgi:small-conductance mechanosensitive channel